MTHGKGGWQGDPERHREVQKRRFERRDETYRRRSRDEFDDVLVHSANAVRGDLSSTPFIATSVVKGVGYGIAGLLLGATMLVTWPLRAAYQWAVLGGDAT
jgi:hypothetical protein